MKKILEEYEEIKNNLTMQLFDERRDLQEGMYELEFDERAKIAKKFKMHYENAKRLEELANIQQKYT